ncbi:MAG: DUF1553 domain-containing protein, partial [Planctomycetales bacterium]|nr:DUF1553 domain-containing protein [Planctomycetales bacterium]
LEDNHLVFAGNFRAPDAIHVLSRGDPEQPRQLVAPAVLSALDDMQLSQEAAENQRRAALADWIASPENPLTSRVMVNRIWQGHFGTGLVKTANDFGHNGSSPSHPELLDWLALEFVRTGWSIKQLHRLIVLSATYRQSTAYDEQAAKADGDVRLLWRYPPRRLEAEAIRDSMLLVSGQLNGSMGGRGFNLFEQRGGLSGFTPIETFAADGLRRMVYAHKVRREPDAVFGSFDCPDAGQSMASRTESTTPVQALNLLNSRFSVDQSAAFAVRIRNEVGADPKTQIERAFELALNRRPDDLEIGHVRPFVQQHGLETLCRALFNCNEFLFMP